MTKTYEDIKKQIALLEQEAEEIRNRDLADAKKQIQSICEKYGLTLADLDFLGPVKSEKSRTNRRPNVEKFNIPEGLYRDHSGKEYLVKRNKKGKKPIWLTSITPEQAAKLRVSD